MKDATYEARPIFLLGLVLAFFHPCTANSCRLLQFKPAINGKRLENHVIQTKKVASDDFCQALCYMETNCVSINSKMDSDQYLCELNDAVAENYPGDLRAAPEFSYFSGESPCPRNPCSGSGATCQVGFDGAGYRCVCPSGYTGQSCNQDIDECSPSTPCHDNATCVNTPGTYVCECAEGFTGDGTNCQDIDECGDANACDANANCTNTPGSYQCNCSTGFRGNGTHCDDIDECTELHPSCYTDMTCSLAVNNSYECQCTPEDKPGSGALDSLSPCKVESACINSPGTFACGCQMRGNPHCTVDLWFPTGNSNDYVSCPDCIQSPLKAFTICFWIRSVDSTKSGTTFSYYTFSDQILVYNYNALSITVGNKHGSNTFSVTDGNWHHICFTWENVQGKWEIYRDGSLEAHATGLRVGYTIHAGGTVVLGQEQDSPEGGFASHQAFIGVLSGVNVWDYVISANEIWRMSAACTSDEGNVITWSRFLSGVRGQVRVISQSTCSP